MLETPKFLCRATNTDQSIHFIEIKKCQIRQSKFSFICENIFDFFLNVDKVVIFSLDFIVLKSENWIFCVKTSSVI